METGEDGSLEPLNVLFGEVTDPDIVAKKKYIYICKHEKLKYDCRQCNPGRYCPHEKRKLNCRQCTPGPDIVAKKKRIYICKHEKLKYNCKQCNPGRYCPHEKRKIDCRQCTPGPDIVAKNKRIYKKCKHDKLPNICRQCSPRNFCKHKKRKMSCLQCTQTLVCNHGKRQTICRECGGSAFCECGIRRTHCPKHGGSALCIVCKLVHANTKYDKHCADCFVNYYPGDTRGDKISKLKRRETVVSEAIDGVFKGFVHDKAFFTGGCCPHRRRIDHRIPINGTVLAIETDENAHVGYDKDDENIRYDDLFMAISTKFIFIRFNCDTTREDYGAKTSLEHKIRVLLSCIGTQITRIRNNENTELCEIVKLFYCKSCSKNGSDICLCPPIKGPAHKGLVGVPI